MKDYQTEEYRGHTIHIVLDEYADSPRDWCNVATFVCEHRHYNLGDVHDIEGEINKLFSKYVKDEDIIKYFCESRNAKLVHDEEDESSYYEYVTTYRNGSSCTCTISADDSEECIAYEMQDSFSNSEKLMLVDKTGEVVLSPISIYDHSGLSIWLGGTAGHVDAQWDCSTVGFAYIEKSTAEKEGALRAGSDGLYNGCKSWQDWAKAMMKDEMETYNNYVSGNVFGYCIDSEEAGCDCDDSCFGYYGTSSIPAMIEEAKHIIDYFFDCREKEYEEYKSIIVKNIDSFIGKEWVIGGRVFHVGSDLFGHGFIERSVQDDSIISHYAPLQLQDLEFDCAKCIAKSMKKSA